MPATLDPLPLPAGVRSRLVAGVNGLAMHVLEAGHEPPGRPAVLLLHGFPELAYSWRHVLPALAAAGYHAIAPDQRGYGRTTGWSADYDGDLRPFALLSLARDALALLHALGRTHVEAVVGHDFGSPVAAWCALTRPDVFRRVVLMSAPFGGPPALPFATADAPGAAPAPSPVQRVLDDLARLPRPRKHYQWYYSTRAADADMRDAPQGLSDFLRAYYHVKSADWAENRPHPLPGWSADALAQLPTYYVMDAACTMAETVAPHMPAPAAVAACTWLGAADLAVYAAEYARTGFQGGLQWYRCGTSGMFNPDMQLYAGAAITVPALYIAGACDWGIHQKPGDFEAMQTRACARFEGAHLVPGAGHWVQQEQPQAVNALLLAFLARRRAG
ncbi:MAG: alpha/beta fold hydrolase [Burkholderiales bacterium]|nr:alpha/beta fold hydrolase [Burkholderiales bacterium]